MENNHIQYISNSDVTVGISAKIGGTIVFVSKANSENILKSDSTLWNPDLRPDITENSDFIPYNGHTVWLGPQSEWWTKQNLNELRKNEKAVWPPDPFITMGEYSIISQNEWSIKLLSPESPISGIYMEKEIAVNPDGSIFVQVSIINSSTENVSWDIWFNTRLSGWNKVYVPALEENCKIVPVLHNSSEEMPYEITNGYFTYLPVAPNANKNERSSKAFIYPELPIMHAFTKNHVISISFVKHDVSEIHTEQGHVEIYNHTEHNAENALLEMEYHSPYTTLAPGQNLQAWEVWTIEEHNNITNTLEQIEFLNNL